MDACGAMDDCAPAAFLIASYVFGSVSVFFRTLFHIRFIGTVDVFHIVMTTIAIVSVKRV
jgi:hypothetical protein